jgi:hypothetical protein
MKRYIPWLLGFLLLAAFLVALPFSVTIGSTEACEVQP